MPRTRTEGRSKPLLRALRRSLVAIALLLVTVGATSPLTEGPPDAPIPWADREAFGIATDARIAELRSLPIFRIFDAQGRLIYDFAGFPSDFEEVVGNFLTEPARTHSRARNDWDFRTESSGILFPSGTESTTPSDFDLIMVKYWADWCGPCRLQTAALSRLLERFPSPRVFLVHVEADLFARHPRRPKPPSDTAEPTEQEPTESDSLRSESTPSEAAQAEPPEADISPMGQPTPVPLRPQ